MSAPESSEPPVLTSRTGRLARVELNRPKAINALTHEMVGLIAEALESWRDDDAVETVLITGRGERGLCAGGDIVAIWKDAKAGTSESADFWADEYRLNHAISTYPKPVVAVMDGIVLGGGIGLSAHASHRIVTERSSVGMPETGIGFVPDVGGTWLLSHAPGEVGTHLGLTAGQVKAGDALYVGLADHYVPSERLDDLTASLATTAPDEAIAALVAPAPADTLSAERGWIDACYAGDDAAVIAARVAAHAADSGSEAAQRADKALRRNSPTSMSVTLAALRRAATLPDLGEALRTELRLTVRFLRIPDFVEGVRAQVIDKDRNPSWSPQRLADVDAGEVAALFAPLEHDLELPTSDREGIS